MNKYITEEPPMGSIVVDCDNDAWQHRYGGWYMSGNGEPYAWDVLVDEYGPLTLVWSPDAEISD